MWQRNYLRMEQNAAVDVSFRAFQCRGEERIPKKGLS